MPVGAMQKMTINNMNNNNETNTNGTSDINSSNTSLTNLNKEIPQIKKYIAKYTYKANADSPGGFRELDLKQGEEVRLIGKHADQPHWCKVKNKQGKEGYVPMSYLVKTEVTSLPWLDNKELEENKAEEKPQKYEFKAYKSAYTKNEPSVNPKEDPEDFSCEICNRKFNGPVPYRAHLRSKAHKEEVELAKEYGRL